MRSHLCGEVNEQLDGRSVQLCGWVQRRRDLGGLIFIGLRDYVGVVQAVVEPDNEAAFALGETLRNEFCLRIEGRVRLRPESQRNPDMPTGAVEVVVGTLEILSRAAPLPMLMSDEDSEEVRMRYRYLDLRRPRMQRNLRTRAALTRSIRSYLDAREFVDTETPVLTRATPEGARDYLVPSRVQRGRFFALPQSPQLFKQLLIMGGIDRYYQIARCFRDEDLRADRQPEFTQLDLEMGFVREADVQALAEGMVRQAFRDVLNIELPEFQRLRWHEAVERFGIDRPDLRIPLELISVDEAVAECDFKVFKAPANEINGRVAALRIPGGAEVSRREIDAYTEFVGRYGARGLAWIKVNDPAQGGEGLQSPIAKFLDPAAIDGLAASLQWRAGDLVLFGAGERQMVNESMGALRARVGHDRGLVEPGWRPLWVVDFPMFEWNDDERRLEALHHPFTAPATDDPAELSADPRDTLSRAYDMVLNGSEIGGGSIRIHDPRMQQAVFDLLGIDEEQARERFGFLLDALSYGCPPLGGIAFGLDRVAALMCGEDSIRDVIAFPKTTTAACPLTGAPAAIEPGQLAELGIRVTDSEQ